MKWVREQEVGRGSFGTVSKARITEQPDGNSIPQTVALKSCDSLLYYYLRNEKETLEKIGICPQIVRCFGDQVSVEDRVELYNLVLEFAPGGTLADLAQSLGGRLPESLIRRQARSILLGLLKIHSRGFVHCDIKRENILVFGCPAAVKIADFGSAVEIGKDGDRESKRHTMRGTFLYMAPESITDHLYEPACDVWALGCLVAELASGRAVWDYNPAQSTMWAMLMRIGRDGEEAEIPEELSMEGRDFVSKCLVRDPKKRWTVPMLLDHPFVLEPNISKLSNSHNNNWMPRFSNLLKEAIAAVQNLNSPCFPSSDYHYYI